MPIKGMIDVNDNCTVADYKTRAMFMFDSDGFCLGIYEIPIEENVDSNELLEKYQSVYGEPVQVNELSAEEYNIPGDYIVAIWQDNENNIIFMIGGQGGRQNVFYSRANSLVFKYFMESSGIDEMFENAFGINLEDYINNDSDENSTESIEGI